MIRPLQHTWLLIVLGLCTGCFQDLFARGIGWQATRYLNTWPRIVAFNVDPHTIAPSSENYTTDALILLPPGSSVESVSLATCGLGRDVPTFLWDLGCFEDDTEVDLLAEGDQFPLRWLPPETPALERADTGYYSGYGGYYGYWDQSIHSLPLLLTAIVDGEPILAATMVDWHTNPLTDNPFDVPLSQIPIRLEVPQTGSPGEEITARFTAEADMRWNTWHWYIDDGVLIDTGVTTGHTFSSPDAASPAGVTTTSNRWVLPDEPGTYRIWAVLTGRPNEMVWLEASVEVK